MLKVELKYRRSRGRGEMGGFSFSEYDPRSARPLRSGQVVRVCERVEAQGPWWRYSSGIREGADGDTSFEREEGPGWLFCPGEMRGSRGGPWTFPREHVFP